MCKNMEISYRFLIDCFPNRVLQHNHQKDHLQETCEVVRIYMKYYVYSLMLNRYDVKRIIAH